MLHLRARCEGPPACPLPLPVLGQHLNQPRGPSGLIHEEGAEPSGAGLPPEVPVQGRGRVARGLPAASGLGWHQGWPSDPNTACSPHPTSRPFLLRVYKFTPGCDIQENKEAPEVGPGGPGSLPAHVPAGGKLSHDGSQGGSRGRPSTAPPQPHNAKCQGALTVSVQKDWRKAAPLGEQGTCSRASPPPRSSPESRPQIRPLPPRSRLLLLSAGP